MYRNPRGCSSTVKLKFLGISCSILLGMCVKKIIGEGLPKERTANSEFVALPLAIVFMRVTEMATPTCCFLGCFFTSSSSEDSVYCNKNEIFFNTALKFGFHD